MSCYSCWECKFFTSLRGDSGDGNGFCSKKRGQVSSGMTCRDFKRKTAPKQFHVVITLTKLDKCVSFSTHDTWVNEDGYEVNVYKNGEVIESDRKYFYLSEKKEAGLYALGLENFYKHFQED